MMKSQEWKAIILKNRKLRLVRTSLRILLREEVGAELNRLRRLKTLYTEKRLTNKLTPSQRKRESILIMKDDDLTLVWARSILRCAEGSICKSIKNSELPSAIATLAKDMVWNTLLKRWICIDCYNHYYRTEAQKRDFKKIIEQVEEEERAFDKWFSNQIKRE